MRQRLIFAVVVAGVIGALFGAIECFVVLRGLPWWLKTSVAPLAMGLYGLANALALGIWAYVARRMEPAAFQVRTILMSLLTMSYFFGGFYVNRLWLPELRALPSLVFNGVWTGAHLLSLWALWRVRAQSVASTALGRYRSSGLQLLLLGLLVVGGGIVALMPSLRRMGQHRSVVQGRDQRPNVLLIVMDTTRADHLSSYGYPRPTTPNLDRVAQEGVLFEHALAAAPWTLPSHASLFTGLYPSQHNAERSHPRLDGQLTTVAELLREDGYQTVGFSNNPWIGVATNFHQGFDFFAEMWGGGQLIDHLALMRVVEKWRRLPSGHAEDSKANLTNRQIRWWLTQLHDPQRPFFMFVNYMEPHFSYEPPEPYRSRFLRHSDQQADQALRATDQSRFAPVVHLDQTTREILTDLYDAEIAYLDANIGELMGELRARQLLDDTIVIITADHGENIGEHELFGHQFCIYETLLRVPMIVRAPRILPGGLRVSERVTLVDVMPTLMKLLGVEQPAIQQVLSGQSWVGSALAVPRERVILAEYGAPLGLLAKYKKRLQSIDEHSFTRELKSLYRGQFKLIWFSDGQRELYDLSRDPTESRNILQQFPQVAHALEAELRERVARLKPMSVPGEAVLPLDAQTHRELRALGYLQ